tara:strand:- start:160 stop:396 length:237 start_codon:yes stop_codon:yes gene_type:complete
MNKFLYILSFCFILTSSSFAASEFKFSGALDWYGYQSMIEVESYSNDHSDDGSDEINRKRRHKRRRKLRPKPKHGWKR